MMIPTMLKERDHQRQPRRRYPHQQRNQLNVGVNVDHQMMRPMMVIILAVKVVVLPTNEGAPIPTSDNDN
jgi:hypothetical protein